MSVPYLVPLFMNKENNFASPCSRTLLFLRGEVILQARRFYTEVVGNMRTLDTGVVVCEYATYLVHSRYIMNVNLLAFSEVEKCK